MRTVNPFLFRLLLLLDRWLPGSDTIIMGYCVVLFGIILFSSGCKERADQRPPAPPSVNSFSFVGPPSTPPQPPASRVQIGTTAIEVPPGSTLTFDHVLETDDVGPLPSFTRSAESSGASLSTTAPEVAAGFDATAPTTTLSGDDGGSASGGDLSASLHLKGMKPSNPLFWIGGLLLIGAGVLLYLKRITAAATAAGVAVVMIACAAFPAFAIVLALGALTIVACVLTGNAAFLGRRAETSEKTARDLLSLNESLPAPSRRLVKDKASSVLSEKTKDTIKRIKRKYNLPSERPDTHV